MLETDRVFAGSIPENYDRYMVPLIFEPYAADMARRAASLSPSAVLEIRTREFARTLRLSEAGEGTRPGVPRTPDLVTGTVCAAGHSVSA
jgi:hypothetical protein